MWLRSRTGAGGSTLVTPRIAKRNELAWVSEQQPLDR
ncbi:hypothetical protein AWB77_04517 [Caballeronia fortuita]|uniref:Uncharacterized protein n=1 Tax=Caballeronia fortuita TaxID=1777138 RepID=A0A158CUS0_9BURK|nr:hypothetical protein AWB77_04517 [Caballeronia fortuita]